MFLAINQNGLSSKKRKKEKEKAKTSTITTPGGGGGGGGVAGMTDAEAIAAPPAATTTTTSLADKMSLEFSPAEEPATTAKCKNCQHALQNGQQQQQRRRQQHQQQQHHQHPPQHHRQQQQQLENDQQLQPTPPYAVTSLEDLATAAAERVTAPSHCGCDCDCECVNKCLAVHSERESANATTKSPSPSAAPPTQSPAVTSLYTVYMCLGTLTLAVATLAVLFYSHVTAVASCASASASESFVPQSETNFAFREQFRRELDASDNVLRSLVAQILHEQESLQQQQQLRQQQQQQQLRSNQPRHYVPIVDAVAAPALRHGYTSTTTTAKTTATETTTTTTTEKKKTTSPSVDDDGSSTTVRNERKYTGKSGNSGFVQRMRRDISSSPSSMHADPFIEFFNPNHRKVLEEQDVEIRKRTGLKGAAPGGDEWIYLNTYCRVPEKIITGFCKGTQEYCPPSPNGPPGPIGPKGTTGPPGLPGIPGPKGNRGDVGLPGPHGVDGAQGALGPRGPKGDIGIPGRAGLDGRDGVPGEPGLDGVPGRAGADGIPGKDGLPGRDGHNGVNGNNGKDGASGPKGAQGPPGERGLKGIAGPRGRPGKGGTNGTPGIPGINAWKIQLMNGSYSNDLLIPPSIADINAPHIRRTVIVEEGKPLNLSCGATGTPLPHVEWRRDDGRTINVLGVEMSSVSGASLKFSNITRNQMAGYICFADNGIAPVANATFQVEVHFSPMISVYRQMIYAEYGHSATLECLVEAFPEAIRYWERAYDGKILDPGDKYRIESFPDGYKTTMRMTIHNLRKDDFGYYHCVARNELNATMVNFEIAPQDPNSETPYVGKEIKVYGQRPPESECPVCEQCPDPGLLQCKDSINANFEILPTGNNSYPGLPKRQKSCLLYAVGKPVFHKAVKEDYGSWLKDAAAKENDRETTFITNENDSKNLFEYTTKIGYRLNHVPPKRYDILEGFHGNAHVVYNGSFYYNQKNTDLVVKYHLNTNTKITTQLPYAGIATGHKLYSTDYNFMDFNVDEVGLWVIYSTYNSNNTLVAKLDAETLKMQYNFNITLDHRKFGEMFIVCGHLYAIDSCTDKNSQIRYVVDLYNGKLLNVELPFSNPFRKTTTVGYNPLMVELYSWDKGNALTYPIRYTEQTLGSDQK